MKPVNKKDAGNGNKAGAGSPASACCAAVKTAQCCSKSSKVVAGCHD